MKKLYKTGFGEHWHYIAADDIPEAIKKVREVDQSFTYLPAVAEEVKEETGFIIGCLHPDELASNGPEIENPPIQCPEGIKIEEGNIIRINTCKKCDAKFENKGEFLAHTRKCGKEV